MIPPAQINMPLNRNGACYKSYRSKYFILFTAEGRLKGFLDQGYSIYHKPSGDGNCQFSELSYVFREIGIHRSARSVCDEVVNYLFENTDNL